MFASKLTTRTDISFEFDCMKGLGLKGFEFWKRNQRRAERRAAKQLLVEGVVELMEQEALAKQERIQLARKAHAAEQQAWRTAVTARKARKTRCTATVPHVVTVIRKRHFDVVSGTLEPMQVRQLLIAA